MPRMDYDTDEDVPLVLRYTKKRTTPVAPDEDRVGPTAHTAAVLGIAPPDVPASFPRTDKLEDAMDIPIPHEGVALGCITSSHLKERQRAYRERAEKMFAAECELQMRRANDAQRACLAHALTNGLRIANLTSTRGKCTYRWNGRKGNVALPSITVSVSKRLIENGCRCKEVLLLLRHELSHAANPGARHGPVWQAYNLAVGGDGKRCDDSEVTKSVIGHTVEVHCDAFDAVDRESDAHKVKKAAGHYWRALQRAPDRRYLDKWTCSACRKAGLNGRLKAYRVSLHTTATVR